MSTRLESSQINVMTLDLNSLHKHYVTTHTRYIYSQTSYTLVRAALTTSPLVKANEK